MTPAAWWVLFACILCLLGGLILGVSLVVWIPPFSGESS